ncbi:MAG: ATP-binding cassette domain-containing protein [Anaerolineae bacterium]|nr:ATP-binding cassette domain-containing protein [Anaerolineae bacterium]
MMIEVKDLTKCYGRFVALDSISFNAQEGEIVGFLGPNGAGKTTTMRILTGYMPPSAGTARIAGLDVFDDSLEMRHHVGYLPETVPLYRDMTVRGYLNFVAKLRGIERRRQRIDDVLERVGMTDRARSLIRNLSKGMRQRVGLAQAIVHDPGVLILDEPTIGLDPHQVQDLRVLIRELGQTRTVMLSTHILSEAEQVCDRVIIIDRGRIVAQDTPGHLQDRLHRGGRLFVRVGNQPSGSNVVRVLRDVPGVEAAEPHSDGYIVRAKPRADIRAALASAVVGHGMELLELRPWAITLEEIFLELTTRLGDDTDKRRE